MYCVCVQICLLLERSKAVKSTVALEVHDILLLSLLALLV
jgi:hypothetical protein